MISVARIVRGMGGCVHKCHACVRRISAVLFMMALGRRLPKAGVADVSLGIGP